jgi:transposase
MSRTALLQERRMLKFRDVQSRWKASELSAFAASELLGMSERQFRRYRARFEDQGEAGLRDRRLGQASPRRVPERDRQRMLDLYRQMYSGWNVRHFHDRLRSHHGFSWG